MVSIYLQSCNNADDGHEKVFLIQLILRTNEGQKLELGFVLKVEICEIRVVARLFFDFFVLFSNLRNSNRKSMTNHWHNQSDVILFFPSWKIHQQIKDDCRRQNEERN